MKVALNDSLWDLRTDTTFPSHGQKKWRRKITVLIFQSNKCKMSLAITWYFDLHSKLLQSLVWSGSVLPGQSAFEIILYKFFWLIFLESYSLLCFQKEIYWPIVYGRIYYRLWGLIHFHPMFISSMQKKCFYYVRGFHENVRFICSNGHKNTSEWLKVVYEEIWVLLWLYSFSMVNTADL